MEISERYKDIEKRVSEAAVRSGRKSEDVTLLAVTKTHGADMINEAIDAGATDIGENRVQELLEKYGDVKPVSWHLIGHLQTNKVKNVIDKVIMIHSVDSLKLAHEINRRAADAGIVMDILIEINLAMEATKSGISGSELFELADAIEKECDNVRIRGIMCIPPRSDDPEEARPYFKETKRLFDELRERMSEPERVDVLSMGMSGDFEVAIEEGSTIVRVGSAIFGDRNYR